MVSCIGTAGMRRLVICILALTALSGYALAHTPAGVAYRTMKVVEIWVLPSHTRWMIPLRIM